MSTQRRVVPMHGPAVEAGMGTKLTGTGISTSHDAGVTVWRKQFRLNAAGLTASTSSDRLGNAELATNSLGSGRSCEWHLCHGSNGYSESRRVVPSYQTWGRTTGSSPALAFSRAGLLPEQPSWQLSPLLSDASEQEQRSARTMQSVLPQTLMSLCSRAERQHGQGNLYLQHAARNAACDFGRRPAR